MSDYETLARFLCGHLPELIEKLEDAHISMEVLLDNNENVNITKHPEYAGQAMKLVETAITLLKNIDQ